MAQRRGDQDLDNAYDEEPEEPEAEESSDLEYLPPRNPTGQRYRRWIPITITIVCLAVLAFMISVIFRDADEAAKTPTKPPPRMDAVSTNGRPQTLDQLRDAARQADLPRTTAPEGPSAQVRELQRQLQEANERLARLERERETHETAPPTTTAKETKAAPSPKTVDAQAVKAAAERAKAAKEEARAKKAADLAAKKDRIMWQRESKKEDDVGAVKTVASPYTLMPGWGIPCSSKYAISSRAAGPVVLHVTQNVYDSATGAHLLMPQGATLNGESTGRTVFGDDTQQVTVDRMTVGKQIYTLGKRPLQDPTGQTGLKDLVETFWGRALMSVVLRSGLQAGAASATVGAENVGERAAGLTAQNAAAEGSRQMQQLINITPRLTYRAAGRCWLTITEPISFAQPYSADPITAQRLAYQVQQGW